MGEKAGVNLFSGRTEIRSQHRIEEKTKRKALEQKRHQGVTGDVDGFPDPGTDPMVLMDPTALWARVSTAPSE